MAQVRIYQASCEPSGGGTSETNSENCKKNNSPKLLQRGQLLKTIIDEKLTGIACTRGIYILTIMTCKYTADKQPLGIIASS